MIIIPVDNLKTKLLGLVPMKTGFRRIIALLLLFVTITGLVMSFSEDVLCAGELPGAHGTANHSLADDTDGNCPCAPSPSSSTNDHFCAGDCGSPSHAPLSVQPVKVGYFPQNSPLTSYEPFKAFPEVYLSKFIPPHILV